MMLLLAFIFALLGAPAAVADSGQDTALAALGDDPLVAAVTPITQEKSFQAADVALQIVDVQTGDEVYAYGADTALNPASVMKVLTSATALRRLGPAYRFYTTFYSTAEISPDGVLEGDLYVKSTGDPTMVVETMWQLVRQLEMEGVVEIDGDIFFDDTHFDRERLIRGWNKKVDIATGPAYFAPLGALSMNYNTASIVIGPGVEKGAAARVELEVPSDAIEIVNETETGGSGARPWLRLEREVDQDSGRVVFTVTGLVPLDGDVQRQYRAVDNPLRYYMSVVRTVIESQDIDVTGRYRVGEVPDDANAVVTHMSKPLAEILNHTNKFSSNFMAEHVLKALGAETQGVPGTTDKGVEAVAEYLDSLGIPRDEYTLVNGSGLSRQVLVRPSHVNAVLVDMFTDPLVAPEFLASLSIGGVDGTLRRRFAGDDQVGRVRGKTGSMNGVYCLAGYVYSHDGHIYAYTFLVNGFKRVRPVRALHQRLGEALIALQPRDAVSSDAVPSVAGAQP